MKTILKQAKRTLSLLLVLLMVVPMTVSLTILSFADAAVTDNWYTFAAKYATSTDKIIAPKHVIKTEGFEFTVTEDNGIHVSVPDYNTFKGTYPVAGVASKYTTSLADLNVKITLDEESIFAPDFTGAYANYSMVWSGTKVTAISDKFLETGIVYGNAAITNGLRHILSADDIGLCVMVTNQFSKNTDTMTASSVYLILYDGIFYDTNDYRPGYRWCFAARNHNDVSTKGDYTGICRGYENIDLSNGLEWNVREDETLGYVVSVNGKEYYRGCDVGYFPINNGDFTDEDVLGKTDKYRESMTYARNDIDLSILHEVEKGYVIVGSVGNGNIQPGSGFTLDTINHQPAATWTGHTHTWADDAVTIAATCTENGFVSRTCTDCGYSETRVLPVLGHKWDEKFDVVEPTCGGKGSYSHTCSICKVTETQDTPPTEKHLFGNWITTIEPGCDVNGEESRTCVNCNRTEKQALPSIGEHIYGEWIITIEPNCVIEGEETRTCINCDAFETQFVPAAGEHTFGEWTVKWNPTCSDNGQNIRYCTNCDASETEDVPALDHDWTDWFVFEYPTTTKEGLEMRGCCRCMVTDRRVLPKIANPFGDVKEEQWYTEGIIWCYSAGYMAGVSDNDFGRKQNVTRAMFATILAKIDGGDISSYNTMSFSDVKSGQWYSNAIEWAYQNGYAAGLAEGYFGRKDNVSREQIALFFYTYSSKNGIDVSEKANLSAFTDLGRVHSWALDAVQWAVAKGLISGKSETTLAPRDSATRAEIALVIKNYVENVKG